VDIAERWSLLKKAILNDQSIQGSDLPDAYRLVFKDLDAGLSDKLKKASAAAEKAGKKQDPASRAAFKAALMQAASVLADYQAHLAYLEPAFLAKYHAEGSWRTLRANLTKIQDDVLAAAAGLG
jgi:hypothetical protein